MTAFYFVFEVSIHSPPLSLPLAGLIRDARVLALPYAVAHVLGARLRQILLLGTEVLTFGSPFETMPPHEWRLAATASRAGPWPALRKLHVYGACDLCVGLCFGPACGFSAVSELVFSGDVSEPALP